LHGLWQTSGGWGKIEPGAAVEAMHTLWAQGYTTVSAWALPEGIQVPQVKLPSGAGDSAWSLATCIAPWDGGRLAGLHDPADVATGLAS
jgi:hypothetical protein